MIQGQLAGDGKGGEGRRKSHLAASGKINEVTKTKKPENHGALGGIKAS